jgi:hypothetical protein
MPRKFGDVAEVALVNAFNSIDLQILTAPVQNSEIVKKHDGAQRIFGADFGEI